MPGSGAGVGAAPGARGSGCRRCRGALPERGTRGRRRRWRSPRCAGWAGGGGTGTPAARCPVRFLAPRSRGRSPRGCGALPRGGARCGDGCSAGVCVPLPSFGCGQSAAVSPAPPRAARTAAGGVATKLGGRGAVGPAGGFGRRRCAGRGVAPGDGRPAPLRTARTPPPRTASTRLSPRVLGWFFFFSLLAEKKKPTSQLPFGVTEPPPLRFVFLIWGHVRVVSAFESERWFRLQLRRSSGALPSVVFPPFGNKERFFLLFSPFFSTFNRKESPFPAPLSSDSRTDRSRSASGAEMLRSRPGTTQRARSSSGGQR